MNQKKTRMPEETKDFTDVLSSSGRYNYLKGSIKNLGDVPVVSRTELRVITAGDTILEAAAIVAFRRGLWRHSDSEGDFFDLL